MTHAAIPRSTNHKDKSAPPGKGSGLIRRFSHSAKSTGQKLRRKASSSAQERRDHSTGPITRRRSDSKTVGSNGASSTDLVSYDNEDLRLVDCLGVLGINDASSVTSEPFSPNYANPQGSAPALPDQLIRGAPLVKVTKKNRKPLRFFLSPDGSRVSWSQPNMPSKSSKHFYVDDIREIRSGEDAQTYRQDHSATKSEAERWFTILYAHPDRSKLTKAIHLIAPAPEDVQLWINTLEALCKHRIDLMTGMTGSSGSEHIIRAHWERETLKRSPHGCDDLASCTLDLQAVEALCRSLHIHCSKAMIQEQFGLADSRLSGTLNYGEFKDFVRRLKERKDILPIFRSLVQSSGLGLTRARFLSFLEATQGVDLSSDPSRWHKEFDKWVQLSRSRKSSLQGLSAPTAEVMDFEAFSSFLLSPSCNVYARSAAKAHFTRPLNEYFISSSHNTYLRGWQFAGESSTEAYITALRRGCRCVEIDCWNGPDGRPLVTHGHTRTTSVLFSDCVSVINRYAFENSEYPVIISLEVHCDSDQQGYMVRIMKDGFGDKLLVQPLHKNSTELPSPEELRYKVLVKVKTSDVPVDSVTTAEHPERGRGRSSSSPYAQPAQPDTPQFTYLPPLSSPPTTSPVSSTPLPMYSPAQRSLTATSASSAGEESDTLPTRSTLPTTPRSKQTNKITKGLADLGVYLQGYKFRGFGSTEACDCNHIFSLDETKAGNLCRNPMEKAQFEDHNQRYMFRVYPKGLRIDSSNFDPNTFWRRGVQMVALNWQTYDPYMQMNQAMFAAGTDQHGYVLKPDYMRQPRYSIDSLTNRAKMPRRIVRFSVDMVSAQQLPRLHSMDREGSINPFVEIQMFIAEDKARGIATGKGGEDSSARNGYSGIGSPYGRRTRVVLDNGYNPQFNDRFDLTLETKHPDLVFVRWIVWNSPNGRYTGSNCTQLAVFTAKLSSLQQGYRHLPLYNGNGEEFIFSTLFCKIKKEDPVLIPTSFDDGNGRATGRGLMRNILTRPLSTERSDKSTNVVEQKKKVMKEIHEKVPYK